MATTSDAVDADPSDGRRRTTSGECSRRAAVMAANARPGRAITLPPGHDRLTIPPDPQLIIGDHPDPTRGDLTVDAPTTIRGAGARSTVIDANHLNRATRLQIAVTGTSADYGGSIDIRGLEAAQILNSIITTNSSSDGGGGINIAPAYLDSLPSRDPLVGPPANRGGPTDTVALLPGSPALDAAKGCPATDQRGVSRPQDATGDIGAYEHTP
ncbi:choice-of-anchor Q domain-containing protein [Streptomyces massasporeus]|uniref:choice-of-anchor Q domain-containing protein n=1 Tax=Streptomyces massasporeus TaxID=67324 RepID=UPI0033348C08